MSCEIRRVNGTPNGLQCKSLRAHTLAAPGAADFLCLLCFRPGASAAKAGVPRTGRRVQSNLIILSCAAEGGQCGLRMSAATLTGEHVHYPPRKTPPCCIKNKD